MNDALLGVLAELAPISAPALLGATLSGRGVTLRITEVEAYSGASDPGSHGHRGPTPRNRHLFGPPGTLYAYRSYGIHTCINVVSGPQGTSSGSLLRGAEVVDGIALARSRRPGVSDVQLARGPGNLGSAAGAVLGEDDGTSIVDGTGPFRLTLAPGLEARLGAVGPAAVLDELASDPAILRTPRTGVAGIAGGTAFPWRFALRDEPTVSAYRRHPRALD
ncbi:DNA-3-methyladenine glycosylase [Curtobacterium sp. VKM Ac-2922]|uniref:DNA-3-methyladenine glycosylase n=1 Tax=Curtobacterium sp. VKM Ac-2922 TaxID=2929475 RepID=UPI001FB46EE0|nr:DNA-3-methyladenine glycosylase [Curtobacterium sp. VKM Ac-2922]MCJ1714394.1 DNA-3-methyladenine glycosylase [Curtobacterium sp. VKM Ac-2922]